MRLAGSAIMTKISFAVTAFFLAVLAAAATAEAAPCLIVTLTGTQSGPPADNGLAGAGTLVRYGDDANNCGAVKLQFDAGRGTTMRLSQVGVSPGQLNAIFFTHMHSDHVDGFADIVQLRWHMNSPGPKIDVVCSSDVVSVLGFTVSCRKLIAHIGDPYLQSGEIAQRHSENKERPLGGPAELINAITFEPNDEPQVVWSSGDVKVSAIRSTHIAGHASYRVDTPAGSVVIGGDASNDVPAPRALPRRPIRSRSWRREWISSCIRQPIQSGAQVADSRRRTIIDRVRQPISVQWPSEWARSTSCSRTWLPLSERSNLMGGSFQAAL